MAGSTTMNFVSALPEKLSTTTGLAVATKASTGGVSEAAVTASIATSSTVQTATCATTKGQGWSTTIVMPGQLLLLLLLLLRLPLSLSSPRRLSRCLLTRMIPLHRPVCYHHLPRFPAEA